MRFFTRDLLKRLNSRNVATVDQAEQEWESAIGQYRLQVAAMAPSLSSAARALTKLVLHDARVSVMAQRDAAHLELLAIPAGDQIYRLSYELWDSPAGSLASSAWPFSKEDRHWLDDEIEAAPGQGRFLHRILLSDGTVLELPFKDCRVSLWSRVTRSGQKKAS